MFALTLAIATLILSAELTNGSLLEGAKGTLKLMSHRKPIYYKLSEGEISRCRDVAPTCYTCISNCEFYPNSLEISQREHRVEYLKQIDICHEEYLGLKAALPEWCVNDAHNFFPVPGYMPTDELCNSMNKVSCTTRWLRDVEKEVRERKLKKADAAFQIARNAQELAQTMESLEYYTRELADLPAKLRRYKDEQESNMLTQAYKHITDPSENETVFAHPIYIDADKIKAENRRLDLYISRNDIYMASMENKFVRRETVNQIPAFLDAISRLQNHIHSKKVDTDAYIQDIKDISERTAIFQQKATNLIYETTHARDVDGTIVLVDKELFELYTALRKERSILSDANVKATFAKLKLISMLRQLVNEISEQQLQKGCGPTEIMTL